MTSLLQITEATASELYDYLGFVPPVTYGYQLRELARAKFYADKGEQAPSLNSPTYEVD